MRLPRLTSLAALTAAGVLTLSSTASATNINGGQIINQTWTSAGNPYVVLGDITVPVGSFLTIEPGTEVRVAASDMQASGVDTSDVEIRVEGTINVNGTLANPVWFHAQIGSATNSWYGLIVESNAASATFNGMLFENAQEGLVLDTLASIDRCTFSRNYYQGVEINAGVSFFDRVMTKENAYYGLRISGGSIAMTNVVVLDNNSYGIYHQGATTTVHSTTIHGNGSRGIYASSGSIDVVNTIISNNSSYGIQRNSSATVNVTNSNVWGNSSGSFSGSVGQTNVLSANPQYVNPPTDLTLQATSVCVDSGTSSGAPSNDFDNVTRPLNGDGINAAEHDMGAFEYVAMPVCGDAILDGNETCDDGAANGTYGFCKGDCSGPGPYCGDGTTNGPETCDDGNTVSGDGCDASCMQETMGTGGGMGTGGSTTTTTTTGAGAGGSGGASTGAGAGSSTGGGSTGAGAGMGSGGMGTGGNVSSGPGACLPGEQVECACPGGTTGVQTCNAEGTGLDACQCGAVPSAPAATEDEGGCTVSTSPSSSDDDLTSLWALLGLGLVAARRRRR